MVKSYDRYEQEKTFGVIAAQSNIVWLPPAASQSTKSVGRALSSGLEEILVWDIKTGEVINRLRDGLTPGASNAPTSLAPSPVTQLAFHQETNIVAAGYNDGTIKVWDLTSASVMITFQGHKSTISHLKFDRSGTRLLSGSNDSTIILWDLVGEEGLFKLKGHKGPITGLIFVSEHPESKETDDLEDYVVSTAKDGLIKLWELKSKQCIETHLAHSNECWSLGINEVSDLMITCGNNDQVKVWELDHSRPDGEKIVEKGSFEKQSKARCVDVQFHQVKNNSELVELFSLQNADRTMEIFRVRSVSEIKKGITKRTKRLKEKGFEDDEILQSIRESEISMMITPMTTVRTVSKIRSCVWVNNGKYKKLDLLISLSNNSIEYHNIPVPEQLKKALPLDLYSVKQHSVELSGHRNDIRAMDISSDNKLLATASNGELKIWNIKNSNVIRTFTLEGGYALCCRFLPGGTLVVVGFKNGDLELYDLASSSLVDHVEKAHNNVGSNDENGSAIWAMDLTPDGKTLITGGNDKSVKFWTFKVEQELVMGSSDAYVTQMKLVHSQTLELTEEVLCVKVSPDSRLLAVSLLNNNVQVVFLDTLKLFLTLYGHKLPVLSIDISHDSKLIITSSADKNIKIWGLDFGDCHKSIFGHQDLIMNVRFIAQSHHFFSSGKDGLIKYWDGDKFECIQKLPAHQLEVWCVAVSSDGQFMVSASHDHSVRVWAATDDQVFLEEEREKEMDELYENTLLELLEHDDAAERRARDDDEENDESTQVSKQTMETLKAGEKLMEALDIGFEDVTAVEAYEAHLKLFNSGKTTVRPVRPQPNAILLAYGISGQEHVLNTITKIRPAQLDDALLVLPFSYTLKLLRLVEIWTNKQNITSNIVNIQLICRVLFFVVRSNAKELVHQRDPVLKNQLIRVKTQLRNELLQAARQLGYNTQGLKYARQQWKMAHETEFIDENEQREYDDKRAEKRTFATLA